MKDRLVKLYERHLLGSLSLIIAVIALNYAVSKPKSEVTPTNAEAMVEQTAMETEGSYSTTISTEDETAAITLPQSFAEQYHNEAEQTALNQTERYEAQVTMNQMNDVYSGDTQTYYVVARALSDPGISKLAKRAFAIPEGWAFLNAETVYEKGLSRVIVDGDYVYVEAHALSTNRNLHEEAVAKVKIVIAKI